MKKIHKISELQPTVALTEYDFFHLYDQTFNVSELGRIKSKLRLHEMAVKFDATDRSRQYVEAVYEKAWHPVHGRDLL